MRPCLLHHQSTFTTPNQRKRRITMIERRGILQHALSQIFFYTTISKENQSLCTFPTVISTLYTPKCTFSDLNRPSW